MRGKREKKKQSYRAEFLIKPLWFKTCVSSNRGLSHAITSRTRRLEPFRDYGIYVMQYREAFLSSYRVNYISPSHSFYLPRGFVTQFAFRAVRLKWFSPPPSSSAMIHLRDTKVFSSREKYFNRSFSPFAPATIARSLYSQFVANKTLKNSLKMGRSLICWK